MDKIVLGFDSSVNNVLKNVTHYNLIKAAVNLLLVLYIAKLAPTPPKVVLDLFENVYFRLAMFSLILWTAQFSPSTSILITLTFMIIMNYSTTGKFWEMMENVNKEVTINDSLKAVDALAKTAASPNVEPVQDTKAKVDIVMANVSTVEGVKAVSNLGLQSITPVAGVPEKVNDAVKVVKDDIKMTNITNAVQTLGFAAANPEAIESTLVKPVVEMVAAEVKTEKGKEALKELAAKATMPVATNPLKVEEDVKTVLNSCYPLRNYDMSKVLPTKAGDTMIEDYQTFTLV